MNKRILVKTNDPAAKSLYLTITGNVDRLAKVSPGTVSLSGVPGERLEAVVTVTPAEKYTFNILGLEQKFGNRIQAELVPPKPGHREWQVKVTALSDKVDDLYDIITLKTDSPFKPRLKIRVYAIYFDNTGKTS